MFDSSGVVELEDEDGEELSRHYESDESEGVHEDGCIEGESQADEDGRSVAGVESGSGRSDAGEGAVGELKAGDPVESVVVRGVAPGSSRSVRDSCDMK